MIVIDKAHCYYRLASGVRLNALQGVTATLQEGEFVCLVGRSGHGKSTLLRALAGLVSLSEGSIVVQGNKVACPSAERGMVFQEDTVFPWMSVNDNVEFGLRMRGEDAKTRARIASEWINSVGLGGFGHSWPKELSGGMRKRVAIATVFANGSPILLMDEPFGPLDYVTRLDLQNLLVDLWRKTGRTIVFVTHDIEEALVLADRLLVLSRGAIVDDIEVDLPRPRDEEVRASTRAVEITKTVLAHLKVDRTVEPSDAAEARP